MCAVFWLLTQPHKNGPWAWNTSFPPSYKEPSQPAWEHLSVLDSAYVPLSCLSVCVIRPLAKHQLHPVTGVVEWRGRNRVLHPAHRSGPCRPSPCVRCGRWPAGAGEPMSPLETHLALSFSVWVKHCFTVKVCELWFSVVTLNHGVGLLLGLLLLVEWKSFPGGDNHCHSLDKVVNTEEPVWRILLFQR